MSDYITDPALLEKLSKPEPAAKDEYVTDPAVLRELGVGTPGGGEQIPAGEFGASEMAQMAAPIATNMVKGPLGYNPQAIKETLAPLKAVIPQTLGSYASNPAKLLTDIAVPVATGIVPPPYASANLVKSGMQVPEAMRHSMDILSKYSSAVDKTQFAKTGVFPPEITTYRDLRKTVGKIDPDFNNLIKQTLDDPRGGANKVIDLLEKAPESVAKNPKFQEQFAAFKAAMPSIPKQIGRVLAPLGRTALRAAGPVGIGMDIAEAYPYLQEANVGPRAAQGEFAPLANPTNFMMRRNQPVLAPIAPDQAQAVLQSGSERDIAAFGGRDKLSEMIRLKAAEKVLGPIAPGQ